MAIDLGLEGARAVVVGAGYLPHRAGHGRGSALNLAAAGATVACIDINEERANGIAQEIIDKGGKAFPIVGNALDSKDITRAIDEAAEKHGGALDVVVDIVGTAWWDRAHETSDDDWDAAILTNLTQVFYTWRAAVPHLIKGGRGSQGSALVALASQDGIQSSRYHVAYGAAKAGVISLAKTFADEYGKYGVRANIVAPGNVGGGNFESEPAEFGSDWVNPLAPPRGTDIADAVLFLSSKLSDRITGQTLLVDGGVLTQGRGGVTEENYMQMKAADY